MKVIEDGQGRLKTANCYQNFYQISLVVVVVVVVVVAAKQEEGKVEVDPNGIDEDLSDGLG